MPSIADVLAAFHAVALILFVGGTSVSMLAAIVRCLRIQRPMLVWCAHGVIRVPIGPSLFLLLLIPGLAYAEASGIDVPPTALVGYPAGGLFWFVATWLARSTIVTEYGIVPTLSCLNQAVAWSQVVEYAEVSKDGRPHFVFVYRDRENQEHRQLGLPVPERCLEEFRDIATTKLEARQTFAGASAFTEAIMQQNDNSRQGG